MVRGGLFSRFFLEDGIREAPSYRSLGPARVLAFADAVRGLWTGLAAFAKPSEAETEGEFIFPVLGLLGWHHLPQQEPGRGRRDIADALLFASEAAKAAARPLAPAERFRRGAVVVENEAVGTLLDRAGSKGEAPSSQLIRYLGRAEAQSDGAVRWGLLTNGRLWRLYWAGARSRAEGYVELDLPGLVGDLPPPAPSGAPGDHWLRVFLLLFGRGSHEPGAGPRGATFLADALAEARRYEERVTAALSEAVFDRVLPELTTALARHDPQAAVASPTWREEAREAALRLLFRLLFLLYAEDRDLLPIHHEGYKPYGLRRMRGEAALAVDRGSALSTRAATWWPRLQALFTAIAGGDPGMGLPPYNGGLFHDAPGALLRRVALPDAALAPLLDQVSREGPPDARRWINYRDLSVQHLGSIYERLLERDLVQEGAAGVALRPNAFARKASGSYYTPDELVRLVIRRAVGPLLDERRAAFAARAAALGADTRGKAGRLAQLAPLDPAERILSLRILDPAMGSGHFLVSLVDYLTDQALAAVADAPAQVPWAEYRSPLLARVEAIRSRVRALAQANGWPVREEHLDDPHLVRRIVLKRCVYGVDLNPMAVELAKLAVWLHSFTVGAPLSFLDHHLRHGDSLFGEFTGPVERDLRAGYGLNVSGAIVAAREAARGMARVEEQSDADLAEVEASAAGFRGVEEDTAPLRAFLDLVHAGRWLPASGPAEEAGRGVLLGGGYGDPVAIAAGGEMRTPAADAAPIRRKGRKADIPAAEAHAAAARFVGEARALAAGRRFLHWEAAFPGVWEDWERQEPPGGFDAVIGNPPWDRMKLQEVEWFAARVPAVAHAVRAADRKRALAALRAEASPVATEYDRAAWTAEAAARVARDGGAYPLLSGGDVNLYSLFVERAGRLVRRDGIVGLLVPSGIAGDKGAAAFFRSVSTTGRLAALLDFENRRTTLGLGPFFPDVDSRFKFCALIHGGRGRVFARAATAFFQQGAEAAEAGALALTPDDFAAVNPNTGTAPVFRGARDAEVTLGIYRRLPVLVDRREATPRCVWPVRYATMLHMTNDSAKFRTEAELRALGAYEVRGGRWEKGEARWLPLMVGRSVHLFDHRAASVTEDAENMHNPFASQPTTDAEHRDPAFTPRPHFWVSEADLDWPKDLGWALGFRDIARPTDARTMIAALVPRAAFGNTLPLLLPTAPLDGYRGFAPLLMANLGSLVLDYVARQKVQGTHVNSYIVEQLPIVPPGAYARRFGSKTAEQVIREDVLRLTYVAHDMEAFARDQGYDGPPFAWDPEDRLRRRARLDALFFHLYGLDRGEADYVLGTFPTVREQEVAAYGRFRTRGLVRNWMAALAAGQPDAPVAG